MISGILLRLPLVNKDITGLQWGWYQEQSPYYDNFSARDFRHGTLLPADGGADAFRPGNSRFDAGRWRYEGAYDYGEARPVKKRPLTDKEKIAQQKAVKKELKGEYAKWVNEDVRWIITDEELAAFKGLSNDEERDQFIESFWLRRNPNPDSPENEYREEHYARIAYANEHFAAGKPGWRTDRGHIYIAYGKPDSIDSHPSGGSYERPMDEGGGNTSTFPFETWHYRYLEGIGDNLDLEFVDTCMCGDYHMTIDRSEKDALKHVPGAGQTLYEQMGMSKQSERMNGGLEQLGKGPMSDKCLKTEVFRRTSRALEDLRRYKGKTGRRGSESAGSVLQ